MLLQSRHVEIYIYREYFYKFIFFLYFINKALLYQLFSAKSFQFFLEVSLGIGGEYHSKKKPRKSIGRQSTFPNTSDINQIKIHLKKLAQQVSSDLKKIDKKVF